MFGLTWNQADAKSGPWQQTKTSWQKSNRPEIRVGERRSGRDRRNDPTQTKKAAIASAQINIRSCDDRRILHYSLSIRTHVSIERIGDWFEENCRGGTCIVLGNPERQNGLKELTIMFELDVDREAFKKFIRMDA
jgi:hypothetical protein